MCAYERVRARVCVHVWPLFVDAHVLYPQLGGYRLYHKTVAFLLFYAVYAYARVVRVVFRSVQCVVSL